MKERGEERGGREGGEELEEGWEEEEVGKMEGCGRGGGDDLS